MTTSYPAPLTAAEPAAQPPGQTSSFTGAVGAWRYDGRRRSRGLIALAVLLSASLHAGVLLGLRPAKKRLAPAQTEHVIALTVFMPEVKDLEEPDPVPLDDAAPTPDLGVPVPMQQDLPQIARPVDFVQQINFASLIDQPDFSAMKVIAIPENIRRGGKVTEGLGPVFRLSDLDRPPVPIFQPAPVVPTQLRRDGVSGTVRLEFVVDTEGAVLNAVVVESSDRRFEDAALTGVAKWKFRPGVKAGRKVNTRMSVPIVFEVGAAIE